MNRFHGLIFSLALQTLFINAMESNIDAILRDYNQSEDSHTMTRGEVAARKKDLPIRIQKCIKEGTINVCDREDFWEGHVTPLYDAAISDELIEYTRTLLANKADPNMPTGFVERVTGSKDGGHIPLIKAIGTNSLRTAVLLVNTGAQVKGALLELMNQVCYNEGKYPSLFEGQKYLFKLLIAKDASVNETDKDQETPLMKVLDKKAVGGLEFDSYHWQVPVHYREYFVRELLYYKADVTKRNKFGNKTAVQIAREQKFFQIADIIEREDKK